MNDHKMILKPKETGLLRHYLNYDINMQMILLEYTLGSRISSRNLDFIFSHFTCKTTFLEDVSFRLMLTVLDFGRRLMLFIKLLNSN